MIEPLNMCKLSFTSAAFTHSLGIQSGVEEYANVVFWELDVKFRERDGTPVHFAT